MNLDLSTADLKYLRFRAKFTLADMASLIGMTEAAYERLET